MDNLENVEPLSPGPKGKFWLYALIIIILVAGSFRLGFMEGSKGYTFDPKTFKVVNQADSPKSVDYNLLWDTISVLNQKYIDRPVDQQKILYGAVKGAVEATGDPYTTFFTPEEYKDFKTELKGSFEGIGAEIGKRDGVLTVVSPLDGSPASKAGLKAGDYILEVDGQNTQGWSTEQAVAKIRGPKGTVVKLKLARQGKDGAFEISIVRDTIEIKSVKLDIQDKTTAQGAKVKIAVIKISRFGDDTRALFNTAVNSAKEQNVSAVILDLRNDPGGYLEGAVEVASYWLDTNQLVVREERSSGDHQDYNSQGQGVLVGMKTVVLINGGSASASEIVSGALQDHKVAKLIGEKSFGKGSVQQILDLSQGAALKVTIAKWITPGGKNLNKDGLNPDIEVKLTNEDSDAGRDPQLDKAFEELLK